MINPLRKKTREHAEKMGLLDIAKKVEELAEMVNILTTAHKRTVEERLEDKGIVKSEGGGGVWYGYKNKYGYGDNSRVINKVILDPEDMIAIETNRYIKKAKAKERARDELDYLEKIINGVYLHGTLTPNKPYDLPGDQFTVEEAISLINTNFIEKKIVREVVKEEFLLDILEI